MLESDLKDFISDILCEYIPYISKPDIEVNTASVKIELEFCEPNHENEENYDDNIDFAKCFNDALNALLNSEYFSYHYNFNTFNANSRKVLLTYSKHVKIK